MLKTKFFAFLACISQVFSDPVPNPESVVPSGSMNDQLITGEIPDGVQVLPGVSLTNFRNGTVSSLNYPENYGNNAKEWYTIQLNPADKYKVVF